MSEASLGAAVGVLVFGIANGLTYEALAVSLTVIIFDVVKWGLNRLLFGRNYRERYER